VAGIRIGISGWRYPPWRGTFYPRRWPQARELEYASGRVGSVEINGSLYSLQHPDSYRAWRDATPDDFVFAVKGGRFITHMGRPHRGFRVRAPARRRRAVRERLHRRRPLELGAQRAGVGSGPRARRASTRGPTRTVPARRPRRARVLRQ